MSYYFKVTRDKATRQIKVSPVMEAPKHWQPYAMRSKSGLVETLRVFFSKKDTGRGVYEEKEVMDMVKKLKIVTASAFTLLLLCALVQGIDRGYSLLVIAFLFGCFYIPLVVMLWANALNK